jgi:hypothetical protein
MKNISKKDLTKEASGCILLKEDIEYVKEIIEDRNKCYILQMFEDFSHTGYIEFEAWDRMYIVNIYKSIQ